MEKLLHQMEKEITFLHEELKSMNTIKTPLSENVVKLKDNHNNENSAIQIMTSKLRSQEKKHH